MSRHRFRSLFSPTPAQNAAFPSSGGFMLCPLVLQQGWTGKGTVPPWQQVYQLAFEQAVRSWRRRG